MNDDEKKRKQREYYQANKDKLLEKQKEYRSNNKDKIQESDRAYKIANKDKKREYDRKNKNKRRELARAYYIANKDKIVEKQKSVKGRYSGIKWAAKDREIVFELTLNTFKDNFYKKPCHYCLDECTGIDRLDSNKGYIDGNMVPCCAQCNIMKLDYDINDFKKQIIKIYHNLIREDY